MRSDSVWLQVRSTRAKLEAKRIQIESERQRNIDLVVKQIVG